jgi:hypothetical protein
MKTNENNNDFMKEYMKECNKTGLHIFYVKLLLYIEEHDDINIYKVENFQLN